MGRSGSVPALTARAASAPSLRQLLAGLIVLVVVVELIGLTWSPAGLRPFVDWLEPLSQCLPALLCWAAVPVVGSRWPEVAVMATGLTLYGAGTVAFVVAAHRDATTFPSVADLGFLCFYPLALAAIVMSARRESRSAGLAIWLDSLLGGLGAAAVLSLVLDRVFIQATGGSLAGGLALIYPVLDLLLMAAVIGVAAIQGRQVSRPWMSMLAGFALLASIDALAALPFASGSFASSPGDVLWPIGLSLIMPWACARPTGSLRAQETVALVVPAIAAGAVLAVLVASVRSQVSTVTLILAILTLVATAGRTQLAFRQLTRLAELRRQASTDELTGLRNRRSFHERGALVLAAPGGTAALLLLDLDRFKEVNDSLGHHVGDELLRVIGARLGALLGGTDLLARLGGDEFAVLLSGTTRDQALALADRLRSAVAEPCTLEAIAVRTDVSIGVSFAPEHGTQLGALLRCADIAMYQAKRARAGIGIYAGTDDTAGMERLRAIQELHTALAEDQLTLHYQPKLDLRTNEVCQVEALVRWDHPVRGLLFPDSFLTLIEDAGLMRDLTDVVLAGALDQAVVWREQGRPLNIAVNLSASSLIDAELPVRIGALLANRNLPSSVLQLEITEDFLMTDRDRARDILGQLRDQKIQISVDDFGTGYSSLAYLRELPVDELKLDRSFVFPMADDARAAALVFSAIGLAHSLGLRMVAEGVESQAALTELIRHGCDQAQGYFISRPLPPAELDRWLDRRPGPAVPRQGTASSSSALSASAPAASAPLASEPLGSSPSGETAR